MLSLAVLISGAFLFAVMNGCGPSPTQAQTVPTPTPTSTLATPDPPAKTPTFTSTVTSTATLTSPQATATPTVTATVTSTATLISTSTPTVTSTVTVAVTATSTPQSVYFTGTGTANSGAGAMDWNLYEDSILITNGSGYLPYNSIAGYGHIPIYPGHNYIFTFNYDSAKPFTAGDILNTSVNLANGSPIASGAVTGSGTGSVTFAGF